MKSQRPVLIVSCFFEPNVNDVIHRLARRSVPWIRLNTETYPLVARVQLRVSPADGLYAVLDVGDRMVDSRAVGCVWNRRQGELILADGLAEEEAEFARSESVSTLYGLFEALACPWVNPRAEEQRASNKLLQLAVAREVGLSVPRTLVTNDPESVREFAATSPGQVLFKPLGGTTRLTRLSYAPQVQAAYAGQFAAAPGVPDSGAESDDDIPLLFSQVLTPEKLDLIDHIVGCPAIFQDYVEKRSEVRVTFIGDRVFAAEIFSQEREETRVDFRTLGLLPRESIPRHAVYHLPPDIEGRLRELMQRLGLVFGCADLIRTPAGEYVFLEVNPSGQWGWIEHLTGLPITDALADYLAAQAAA